MNFTGKALLAQIVADSKTACGQHRTLGYAYAWSATARRSTLVCRGCGAPDSAHETLRETVERTAREMYDGEV